MNRSKLKKIFLNGEDISDTGLFLNNVNVPVRW